MVDPVRLKTLLDRVSTETAELRRSAGASLEELQPDLIAAVKYRFIVAIVAIEAAIDASRHLAAARGLRMATDYADAFVVLGEAGLLDLELVRELKNMAGFRNLLVHGYAVVDDARVIEIPETRLGDLDDFRRQVAAAVSG